MSDVARWVGVLTSGVLALVLAGLVALWTVAAVLVMGATLGIAHVIESIRLSAG